MHPGAGKHVCTHINVVTSLTLAGKMWFRCGLLSFSESSSGMREGEMCKTWGLPRHLVWTPERQVLRALQRYSLSVCLSVSLSVCLSAFLPVGLSVSLSVCRSVCLPACLSVCRSVCHAHSTQQHSKLFAWCVECLSCRRQVRGMNCQWVEWVRGEASRRVNFSRKIE